MKKGLNASFTVEATLIFSFLMIVEITFVFMLVYAYDRALMVQDANAIISDLRIGETDYIDCVKEHSYLAIDSPAVSLKRNGLKQTVTLKGEWIVPVWPEMNMNLGVTKEITIIRPETVLFLTEDIRSISQ